MGITGELPTRAGKQPSVLTTAVQDVLRIIADTCIASASSCASAAGGLLPAALAAARYKRHLAGAGVWSSNYDDVRRQRAVGPRHSSVTADARPQRRQRHQVIVMRMGLRSIVSTL